MKMVSKIVYDKYPDYDLTIKETLIKDTIKYVSVIRYKYVYIYTY